MTETQPAGYRDGKDAAPTGGGNSTAVNDQISNIVLASGASATGYLFGEHAGVDVVITQTPASTSVVPGGTVTISYTVRNTGSGHGDGGVGTVELWRSDVRLRELDRLQRYNSNVDGWRFGRGCIRNNPGDVSRRDGGNFHAFRASVDNLDRDCNDK